MRFRFIKLLDRQEADRWYLLASPFQVETPAALGRAGLPLYSFPGGIGRALPAHENNDHLSARRRRLPV